MKIKYLGPRDKVNVEPYGPQKQNEVKEYPDDFGEELLATSVKQRFEALGGPKPEPKGKEKNGKADKAGGK